MSLDALKDSTSLLHSNQWSEVSKIQNNINQKFMYFLEWIHGNFEYKNTHNEIFFVTVEWWRVKSAINKSTNQKASHQQLYAIQKKIIQKWWQAFHKNEQRSKIINPKKDKLVIYGNFYVLFWYSKNDWLYRISKATPITGNEILSKKEQLMIEADINNGTNISQMKVVERRIFKWALAHIVNKHKKDEIEAKYNWKYTFHHPWNHKEYDVTFEKAHIIDITSNWTHISTKEYEEITSYTDKNEYSLFAKKTPKAANDDIFENQSKQTIKYHTDRIGKRVEQVIDPSQHKNSNQDKPSIEESTKKWIQILFDHFTEIKPLFPNLLSAKDTHLDSSQKREIYALFDICWRNIYMKTSTTVNDKGNAFLSEEGIKKAFIQIRNIVHPDKNKGSKISTELFQFMDSIINNPNIVRQLKVKQLPKK